MARQQSMKSKSIDIDKELKQGMELMKSILQKYSSTTPTQQETANNSDNYGSLLDINNRKGTEMFKNLLISNNLNPARMFYYFMWDISDYCKQNNIDINAFLSEMPILTMLFENRKKKKKDDIENIMDLINRFDNLSQANEQDIMLLNNYLSDFSDENIRSLLVILREKIMNFKKEVEKEKKLEAQRAQEESRQKEQPQPFVPHTTELDEITKPKPTIDNELPFYKVPEPSIVRF